MFKTARKQAKAAESGARLGANYQPSFGSARALFGELTPSRIDLLEALHPMQALLCPCAGEGGGAHLPNVHTDVGKLEEHGLLQRRPQGQAFLFEAVEIHLAVAKRTA